MTTAYIFTEVSEIRWRDDTVQKWGGPSVSRTEQTYFLLPRRVLVEYDPHLKKIYSVSHAKKDLSEKLQVVQNRRTGHYRETIENLREMRVPEREAEKMARELQDRNLQMEKLSAFGDPILLGKKQRSIRENFQEGIRQQEISLVERIKYLAAEQERMKYYDREV